MGLEGALAEGDGDKGHRGTGAEEEEEDGIEREDKVKRRLSAQLIDSSAPTGINTRKLCMCVRMCARTSVCKRACVCARVSVLMIYHVNLSKGLSTC